MKIRKIFLAGAILTGAFVFQAHAATVQTFYTQSSAYDFINPPCDSGRQAGATNCAAAGEVLRNGVPAWGGEAQSYADLAKGVLHASAMSFGVGQISPLVAGGARASARMFDTLTFDGPIGLNDFVTVTMIATLTHTDTAFTSPLEPFGVGHAWMQLEAVTGDGRAMARAFACTPDTAVCTNNANSGSYEIDVHDNTYTIRSAIRLIDLGPLRSLQLLFALGADSSVWGSANADDPILISLPEGISYTSASGVFLTAVPLPASLPLLAAGLVAVGLRRRRATPLRS